MLASETNKHWKTGYVSGSFDLLHIGHINLIRRAKERCDRLIVGVLTDELIFERKGKHPIMSLEERMAIVETIKYVDEVIVTTPDIIPRVKAWEKLRFDAFFTGDDYMGLPGQVNTEAELNKLGADLVFFPYTKEQTSTMLQEKMKASGTMPPVSDNAASGAAITPPDNTRQSKVSMVVPCYNKVSHIAGMLRSVYNQVWDNIEVILVNDGSTDGTRDVISQWEPKLRQRGYSTKIIDRENAGCCAAVYAGLKAMTGDYFCLADCDDEITPEYVSRMAGWLDKHPEHEWAACSYMRNEIKGSRRTMHSAEPPPAPQDTGNLLVNYILRRVITMTWIYMTRVSYLNKCKLTENFCTERRATYEPLIAVPLMAGGGKLKFFDEPLYIFNIFANGLYSFGSFDKMVKYYDDYLYLYKWSISRLGIDTASKDRLYKAAQIVYCTQVMYQINTNPEWETHTQTYTRRMLKLINESITPAPCIDYERITKDNFAMLTEIISGIILNTHPQLLPPATPNRRIIAYGALGRRAKRLLPHLENTPLRPTDFWDAAGLPPATPPQFDTLTENDIIIVFPKDPEILDFIRTQAKNSGSGSAAIIPTYPETPELKAMLTFPEFYTANIQLTPIHN